MNHACMYRSFCRDLENGQAIDGAVRWNTMGPKLLRAFGHQGARNFSENDWLKHIHEGSNKMRFEYHWKASLTWIVP